MVTSFKSFYKTVGGGEGDKCYYPTRLDPYGKGCFYNCKYCYAKQLLDFRKLWKPNDVGVAPIEDVKKTVFKKIDKGSVVRLGGMTDCFQPIEKVMKNTYKTIDFLNRKKIHYLIVTKSDLLIDEKYLRLLDEDLAHIQVSICSDDDKVLDNTDNAPSFESRKGTIETLYDEGFDVSLRLAPILYETMDFNVVNDINVDKCLVEFLRVKPSMMDYLKEYITSDKYSLKEGGYRHLELSEKLNVLDKLHFKELSVCDDVQEHYDYFKENINFNKDDCCNLRL